MKCYCANLTSTFGISGLMFWKIFGYKASWKKIDPEGLDENNYCLRWEGRYIRNMIISALSDLSAIILNALIAVIFAKLSKFKKRHTTILEQTTGFSQIFSQEFFNMGCILLLRSFDPSGTMQRISGQKIPIIYDGFSYEWYSEIGLGLCIVMFMSTFATNIAELKQYLQA